MTHQTFSPVTLPNGSTLKNRLVKAAMEENMAEAQQLPGEALFRLYEAWAQGGVGLIITGNVMVDHLAMTGPGGLALEKDTDLAPFKKLAAAGKRNGAKIWMQINHPGRQVFKSMGGKVLSPSDVALDMGKHSHMFPKPRPMTAAEIADVIERFAATALRAQYAGFDGVEIHAAHGYLLSQFLSPLTNKRTDRWGGSIQNRARLLLEVIKAVRRKVRPDFAVAVKLNSADFQRGGFDVSDAQTVLQLMQGLGLDMVELSGGSYEVPAMQGLTADGRTLAREAYFLEFAAGMLKHASFPLMVTGGIKRLEVAEQVVTTGVTLVGMASALAMTPDLPNRWKAEPNLIGAFPQVAWKDKTLRGLATMAVVKRQLRRVGNGQQPLKAPHPAFTLISDQLRALGLVRRYRRQYAAETK